MKRLIDANELITALYHYEHEEGGIDAYTAQDIINSAPTIDAVEVVRCKECKWNDGKGHCKLRYGSLGVFDDVSCDDYCSYGEREGE